MTEDRRTDEPTATAGAAPNGAESQPAAPEPAEQDSAGPEATAADEAADAATAQLEALRAEMDTLNERHLRLAAEFDNYRKRNERERAEQRTRAQAELVGTLLEVLDDLQRVVDVDAESATVESLLEGTVLVEKKFRHALGTAGLEPIHAEGEFFNPETMEALMTVPAESAEDDDMVADVFQRGYRFKDQLIRPARVRVHKYES